MNADERTAFYIGGIYFDLDSFDLDMLLESAGMDVETHEAKECAKTCKAFLHFAYDTWYIDFEKVNVAREKRELPLFEYDTDEMRWFLAGRES